MSPESSVIKGSRARVSGSLRIPAVPLNPRPEPASSTDTRGEERAHPTSDEVIRRARRDAARTLIAARRKRDEIYRRTRIAADERGYSDGLQRAESLLREIEQWWASIREAESDRSQELAGNITELVAETVGKVLEKEMASDRDTVLRLVENNLRRFTEVADITLAVSPGDLPHILENRERLAEQMPPRTELLLTSDPDLESGEFRLLGDEGIVVGTVDELVRSLRRRIEDGERSDD